MHFHSHGQNPAQRLVEFEAVYLRNFQMALVPVCSTGYPQQITSKFSTQQVRTVLGKG